MLRTISCENLERTGQRSGRIRCTSSSSSTQSGQIVMLPSSQGRRNNEQNKAAFKRHATPTARAIKIRFLNVRPRFVHPTILSSLLSLVSLILLLSLLLLFDSTSLIPLIIHQFNADAVAIALGHLLGPTDLPDQCPKLI